MDSQWPSVTPRLGYARSAGARADAWPDGPGTTEPFGRGGGPGVLSDLVPRARHFTEHGCEVGGMHVRARDPFPASDDWGGRARRLAEHGRSPVMSARDAAPATSASPPLRCRVAGCRYERRGESATVAGRCGGQTWPAPAGPIRKDRAEERRPLVLAEGWCPPVDRLAYAGRPGPASRRWVARRSDCECSTTHRHRRVRRSAAARRSLARPWHPPPRCAEPHRSWPG